MKWTTWIACTAFGVLGMSVSLAVRSQTYMAEVVAENSSPWNAGLADVRAGPDESFPAVGAVRNGELVRVYGCVEDYQWCDISDDGLRGWMHARHLSYRMQNRPLVIAEYGPSLALPILTFVLGTYWADYYRDRYWYPRNSQWHNWHYRPRPPNFVPAPHRPPHVQPRPPQGVRPPVARPPSVHPSSPRPPNARPPHAGGATQLPEVRPPPRPQRPAHNQRPPRKSERSNDR